MPNFNELKARGAALVTGASRGLGFQMARELSGLGFDVVLTASDAEALEKAARSMKTKAYVYAADLTVPGGAERLYNAVKSDGINVSVLVNNAGIGASGEAWTVSRERDEKLISLNVSAATELAKLFLADACGRGYGALCCVCSVGAFQPGPYTASYYASKSYLHSYTLACRYEAKKYGVTVTSLCPGPLDTEFFQKAGANRPGRAMSAEKAARYAVPRFLRGRKTVIPGFLNRCARILPAGVKTRFIARIKEKKQK